MTLRDIKLRARALMAPRRVERELNDELDFHLEREVEKLVAGGMNRADARGRARARFGSVALAAEQCRDQRGTAFIDDCVRDTLYALRGVRRAPLAALTIVLTVALGLGLVATVFTAFNLFVFRVDAVQNPDELFGVERPRSPGGERIRFTLPEYEALRRETAVFSDAVAMLPDITSRIDGRLMEGTLVTGNFFQVLGVNPALGRALMPSDDERGAGRPVMVLSHAGWSRLFERDPAALGRAMLVNGFEYEIVGVMPEGFRGLSVGSADYWAPLSLLGQFRRFHAGREHLVALDVVGRLKPGLSPKTALAELTVWASGRSGAAQVDARGPMIALEPRRGTIPRPRDAVLVFSPIFFAFGLILMIGCANVANLLLARAVARQREIGIRLSLGASRRRIVRQLLTESLLLALAAAALGFGISRAAFGAALYAVASLLPPEITELVSLAAPAADWRVQLFLVAGAIVSTVSFGLAPALQATRLELVRTMRGEVARDARPGRARNGLIAIQVGAATLLLICAAVFLRSAMASATVDPGLRTEDVVIVEILNQPVRAAMVRAVSSQPFVRTIAASLPDAYSRPRRALADATEGQTASTATASSKAVVAYRYVSPEYFGVLDIPIARGRGFTAAERSPDAAVVIVAEALARRLWPDGDAVGRTLRLEPDPQTETRSPEESPLTPRTFTVVGVSRDVIGVRLTDFREANVYVPIDAGVAKTSLVVRVSGDPDVARRTLLERLVVIDPNMGQVATLRTLARMETSILQIAFAIVLALGVLALSLTVSGLFSVLTYLVEQRTREIGVRMALGATTRDIVRAILSQSIRPVTIGLLAGTALAGSLAGVLLSLPAAGKIGDVVHALDPVAYVASLICIVTACLFASAIPALRAARIDPIATLRRE
jgi:predicted permease